MKTWADYLQPNGTLRNKLGITDEEELHVVEYDVSKQAQQLIRQNNYCVGDYHLTGKDVTELKRINAALLGDIYDWAGHYREVDFNKTSDAQFIHKRTRMHGLFFTVSSFLVLFLVTPVGCDQKNG